MTMITLERQGDWYAAYDAAAEVVASIVGCGVVTVVLHECVIPRLMAGFAAHRAEEAIAKLERAGIGVALVL